MSIFLVLRIALADLVRRHRRVNMNQQKLLAKTEVPYRGTLVSIDAEFVSLQQEEVEYRSNGVQKLIRPSRMALARVSVIRGEGEETGVPFIDDYIQVNEPIVDYLTEFSGIRRKVYSCLAWVIG